MNAIITFQGFRESAAHRSGTEDLYWNVIRQLASPTLTTYHPREWTANVKVLVDQLARQGIRSVALVSYSHGQAAATAFARYAYQRGIDCPLWLACDPVYRPTWLPRWNILQPLAFRALCKRGTITVPENIRRVSWVRQSVSMPRGHDLIPASPATSVQHPRILPYSHVAIDAAPEWFEMVEHELRAWIYPPKALIP